jgi:hypothetical protein
VSVETEIARASEFGRKIEHLVVGKKQLKCERERERLLLGYWALAFDYHKGILALLSNEFFGGAFALVRPVMEAVVRAHLILRCSEQDFQKIKDDEYRTNFATVGKEIDEAFGLGTFFNDFLNHAREALHSFTHSGVSQLARRFKGDDLLPNYSEGERVEVIRTTTSAVFMVTALATKTFGCEEEWKANNELFNEWGKHPEPIPQ